MITRITITGADDTVKPQDLMELSGRYPKVEWGILMSKKQQGGPRFPSMEWIDTLRILKERREVGQPEMNLSCHLCGAYVREFLQTGLLDGMPIPIWDMFDRVQLNTHGEPHRWNAHNVDSTIRMYSQRSPVEYHAKEFIFQYDDVNTDLIEAVAKYYPEPLKANFSTLFDGSHGAGVSPNQWPQHLAFIRCGYAGGLGPDNLMEQLPRIHAASGGAEVWVDMESKVRNLNDDFDLGKVVQCLDIFEEYTQARG